MHVLIAGGIKKFPMFLPMVMLKHLFGTEVLPRLRSRPLDRFLEGSRRYLSPPSTKPTLPGAVATDIQEKRSRRNLGQRSGGGQPRPNRLSFCRYRKISS